MVNINNWHQKRISEIVIKKLYGTIKGKKIVVLGFAFKANTNDTRESAAIKICKDLIDEGANLIIHDPKVNPRQIENDLQIKQISEVNNEKDIFYKISLVNGDLVKVLTFLRCSCKF